MRSKLMSSAIRDGARPPTIDSPVGMLLSQAKYHVVFQTLTFPETPLARLPNRHYVPRGAA